jgi:hypothetical protein
MVNNINNTSYNHFEFHGVNPKNTSEDIENEDMKIRQDIKRGFNLCKNKRKISMNGYSQEIDLSSTSRLLHLVNGDGKINDDDKKKLKSGYEKELTLKVCEKELPNLFKKHKYDGSFLQQNTNIQAPTTEYDGTLELTKRKRPFGYFFIPDDLLKKIKKITKQKLSEGETYGSLTKELDLKHAQLLYYIVSGHTKSVIEKDLIALKSFVSQEKKSHLDSETLSQSTQNQWNGPFLGLPSLIPPDDKFLPQNQKGNAPAKPYYPPQLPLIEPDDYDDRGAVENNDVYQGRIIIPISAAEQEPMTPPDNDELPNNSSYYEPSNFLKTTLGTQNNPYY